MVGDLYRSVADTVWIETSLGRIKVVYLSAVEMYEITNSFSIEKTDVQISFQEATNLLNGAAWPQWALNYRRQQNSAVVAGWMSPVPFITSRPTCPIEHLAQEWNELPPGDISTPYIAPGCEHSYKQYVGLSEVFEYCTKCDAKKP